MSIANQRMQGSISLAAVILTHLIYLQNLGSGTTLQKHSGGSLSIADRETVRFILAVGKARGLQDPPTTSETTRC